MTLSSLSGKRILVTHADTFMGPAICQRLQALGATVIADTDPLLEIHAPARLIERIGSPDVLVANLAMPAPNTRAIEVEEQEWQAVFDTMVHPLMRLCTAVLPGMQARKAGKILLIGSAAALRGMKRASSYSAARGAQLAYIQALGVEMALDNIQINAIAQNFVDNPTYFPPEVQANPRFQQRLASEVPLGRLVSAEEDAEFVAYLCSDAANCFVGQVFPLCGGWVGR